ncbi:MAG TPA: hypothetical protein VEQ60_00530 [Longimicrobium sp.]|nr:hypothetical protein [Longimicrobium sp.]
MDRDAVESSTATVLEVEYDEPLSVECECCGAQETRLTRFVKRDGNAYGVYLVRYTEDHDSRQAYAMISLGTWWVDGVPPDRVAFALRITDSDDEYQLEVIDANQLAWHKSEILGRKLNREEALAHPWLSSVYQLFDHMVQCDAPLHAFLSGPRHPS